MNIKINRFLLAGLLAGAGLLAVALPSFTADTNAPAATPPAVTPAAPPPDAGTPKTPMPSALTGAELYSMHCNRCHAERYPTERTAAQWKTIMLHMQVRANIPGAQARLILKYLQENSGR
jgi:cytochrome c5